MIFFLKRIIFFTFIFLCNVVCCHSQTADMDSIISKGNFACEGGAENCCVTKIILGELPMDILFTGVKLDKNNLFISGEILTEIESLTIIIGYETDNKICPIRTLKTLSSDEYKFEIDVSINTNSVIYFQSLSFKTQVYYVGRLL